LQHTFAALPGFIAVAGRAKHQQVRFATFFAGAAVGRGGVLKDARSNKPLQRRPCRAVLMASRNAAHGPAERDVRLSRTLASQYSDAAALVRRSLHRRGLPRSRASRELHDEERKRGGGRGGVLKDAAV
jgi:hypothetical protein